MKKGTKVVIGVVITVLLIIGLVIGGLVGGFFYLDYKLSEFRQENKQGEVDGREFGKTTDQNGCMEKGFTLSLPNNSYDLSNVSFINGCLKSSRPTPDFCEGVPFLLNRKWFDEQCQKVGHNTDSCKVAFIAKRNFCMESKGNKSN